MILDYKKVPESEVKVVSPSVVGGLKSEEYLTTVNRHGKMPALVGEEKIVESDTIARFLGGKYDAGGSFAPLPGSELAFKADRICRHHDVYLAPLQGALYKESPRGQGFAVFGTRDAALDEFQKQLRDLEDLIDDSGPYLLGPEPTQADCAVFPTLVFAEHMLPKFDRSFNLEPKLLTWWQFMIDKDTVAPRIREAIRGALAKWDDRNRWGPILGAGFRDDAPPTIFDKIIQKDIPADIVYEDDLCLAFRDINPAAPVHLLLIPKVRSGLTQLQNASEDHIFLLGYLMAKVGPIAQAQGLDSYRVVVNDGASASQSVFHLHLHILGGRDMTWPPG